MLALTNGRIWTGHGLASSLTILGDRIHAVGGEIPRGAEVIDLKGRMAVPGFIDNHLHFVMGSLQLEQVQLRDAKSLGDWTRRIAEHARASEAGRWITGGGWDEQQWSPATPPSRHDLDPVTPQNPVFVSRLDLHMGVANSIALRAAGITRDTPNPAGGAIVRDARGEPTGLLKDAAMQLVSAVIPPPTLEERKAAIRRGLHEAARLGVTSFSNMAIDAGAFDDLRAFQQLGDELTARVWMYQPIRDWKVLANTGIEKGFGTARLRLAGLKAFSDGSLGSSTAAFRQPYHDADHCGLLMRPMLDGSMAEWIAGADAANLQLAIHAIGDRANDDVLTMLESRPNPRERRFRIEHAQHLDAGLVARFARSGIIASMQPYHAVDDGRWAESRIGSERAPWAFPFRSLIDAGVHVTFGSDWPVAPLDPLAGLRAAVTREWIPEQRVTIEEALRCYTVNNAWAVFAEKEIGALAPGMRADVVVLSGDVFADVNVTVDMTIFDGTVIV